MSKNSTDAMVYDISDIQSLLKIGRTTAYAFIQEIYKVQKPFRVLKIGGSYKIPKASFDQWILESK